MSDLEATKGLQQKEGPAIIGATFDGERTDANVQVVTLLGFDLDGESRQNVRALRDRLQEADIAAVLHSTWSDGDPTPKRDGQPGRDTSLVRARVLIPLAEPVDAVTYRCLWRVVNRDLIRCPASDPAVGNPSRIWYTARTNPRGRKPWLQHLDGEPLDPAPYIEECAPERHGRGESLGWSAEAVKGMLQHIDPEPYDTWLEIGMVLHHWSRGSTEGLAIWDAWSQGAANYKGRADLERRWRGFGERARGPLVTIGTLVHRARQSGWRPRAKRRADPPVLDLDAFVQRFADADDLKAELAAVLRDQRTMDELHRAQREDPGAWKACCLSLEDGLRVRDVHDLDRAVREHRPKQEGRAPLPAERRDGADTSEVRYRTSKGEVRLKFGERVHRFGPEEDEDGRPTCTLLGRHVYPPPAVVETVDSIAKSGVRVPFKTRGGRDKTVTLPNDSLGDRRRMSDAGAKLAQAGVQIATGKGADLVDAIGRFRDHVDLPVLTVAGKPGWHRDAQGRRVYANAATGMTHGAPAWQWSDDKVSPTVEPATDPIAAGRKAGAKLAEVATTSALRLALNIALVGPLLRELRQPGRIVHLCGPSSKGKSSALRLAGSVWCLIRVLRTWNTTSNALEQYAEDEANDGLVLLDEIRQAGHSNYARELVRRSVHLLNGGIGRDRSNQRGSDRMPRREWRCMALSSGESSMADVLGDAALGGELVRCIDIEIRDGEVTEDREHAQRIADLAGDHDVAGYLGDAWVAHLVGLDDAAWSDLRERVTAYGAELRELVGGEPDAELGRIIDSMAVVAVAAYEADRAGLLPLNGESPLATVGWACKRIAKGRKVGGSTPEERTWRALARHYDAHPAEWPDEEQVDQRERMSGKQLYAPSVMVGIRRDGEPYTCESLLKASGIPANHGVGPRRLLQWAADTGHATFAGRMRIGRSRARWYHLVRLDFDDDE